MAKFLGFELPSLSRAKNDSAIVGRKTAEEIKAASQEVKDDLYAEKAETEVDELIANNPEWAAATEEIEAEEGETVTEIPDIEEAA